MSLFIEEEGNIKLDFDTEEIAALVIDAALELADCPYEAEINLLLTENAQIHEMNLEQRGIDRPTDVLSFPMIEYEEPGDFSVIDEESAEAFNPESGELMLGDIVISKEKVLSQAEEYGHLPKREYAFLIAHSMLHLFGYDHMVDEERVVMEAKQKEIMEKVGLEKKDIRRSINSQVLTVFFLPLIVAGIHIAFALPLIDKLMGLLYFDNIKLFILTTAICFGVFALILRCICLDL